MTLSFLQLLKFEKARYPYFFNLWPRGRDIGLFSLDDGTYSSSSFWKVTLQRKHFPVEFRAGSDVFEIIEACRMGAACKQIENQTFIFFAPPNVPAPFTQQLLWNLVCLIKIVTDRHTYILAFYVRLNSIEFAILDRYYKNKTFWQVLKTEQIHFGNNFHFWQVLTLQHFSYWLACAW